jgi:hypothetical protein
LGDVVAVADINMQPLALAVFNPLSMFRVRWAALEANLKTSLYFDWLPLL